MRSRHNKIKLLSCLEIDSYMALRPGEGARALRFALCPFPGALMTYPDERSESLEGQMQSYTVPERRSLFETDV